MSEAKKYEGDALLQIATSIKNAGLRGSSIKLVDKESGELMVYGRLGSPRVSETGNKVYPLFTSPKDSSQAKKIGFATLTDRTSKNGNTYKHLIVNAFDMVFSTNLVGGKREIKIGDENKKYTEKRIAKRDANEITVNVKGPDNTAKQLKGSPLREFYVDGEDKPSFLYVRIEEQEVSYKKPTFYNIVVDSEPNKDGVYEHRPDIKGGVLFEDEVNVQKDQNVRQDIEQEIGSEPEIDEAGVDDDINPFDEDISFEEPSRKQKVREPSL